MTAVQLILLVMWLQFALIAGQTSGPGCVLLEIGDLGSVAAPSREGLIASTLGTLEGEARNPSIQILAFNTVCLAQAESRDRYRTTSVVVRYLRNEVEVTAQYEFTCDSDGMWGFGSSPTITLDPIADLTTPLRVDCILCVDPNVAIGIGVTELEHCAICDTACVGLRRCTGSFVFQSCCNFFDMSDSCVETCPQNSQPNDLQECVCETGFTESPTGGCDLIDECDPNPCQNGGTCTDLVNGFTCACEPGFTGDTCQTNIDECDPDPCQNGGTCTDLINDFSCSCVPGFTGDTCQNNIDECDPDPCQNGGTCTDLVNGFTCDCDPGFTGDTCQINIDECDPNPCQNGGTCTDLINDFSCTCVPGFTGDTCQMNIDECDPNPCQNEGTCTDLNNDFSCACESGFTGDTCEIDDNECDPNPCENGGTCTDLINDFSCSCVPGFTGDTCQTNIDECDPNPCENGGTCTDLINDFSCSCVPGFTGDACQINIAECDPNPCQNGGTCTDLINDFSCACVPGFTGDTCQTNIDECNPNPCQNGGTCTDLINNFSCSCPLGFAGTTCSVVMDNDTIIGDPLYTCPIHHPDYQDLNMCYEIHGKGNAIFNLVSDTCVSVNARYFAANRYVNVINSIGIRAEGESGVCHNVRVDLREECGLSVGTDEGTVTPYEKYSYDGISARKIRDRVRITLPNCKKVRLVVWVTCERGAIDMIRFQIVRGLNLNPTSHGLLGQFWNVPLTIEQWDKGNAAFNVTISPVDSPPRSFLGELYHKTWDNTKEDCLYVGSSQGGPTRGPEGLRGSVIEGEYTDYIVGGLFETNFKHQKMDGVCSQ